MFAFLHPQGSVTECSTGGESHHLLQSCVTVQLLPDLVLNYWLGFVSKCARCSDGFHPDGA